MHLHIKRGGMKNKKGEGQKSLFVELLQCYAVGSLSFPPPSLLSLRPFFVCTYLPAGSDDVPRVFMQTTQGSEICAPLPENASRQKLWRRFAQEKEWLCGSTSGSLTYNMRKKKFNKRITLWTIEGIFRLRSSTKWLNF